MIVPPGAHAAVVMANSAALALADMTNQQLQEALATRDMIGQAKGMIMARQRVNADTDLDALEAARRTLGMSVWQLWVDYVALGGNLPSDEFEALLRDGHQVDGHNYDLIVQALNEQFVERDQDHPLPYADELPPS